MPTITWDEGDNSSDYSRPWFQMCTVYFLNSQDPKKKIKLSKHPQCLALRRAFNHNIYAVGIGKIISIESDNIFAYEFSVIPDFLFFTHLKLMNAGY